MKKEKVLVDKNFKSIFMKILNEENSRRKRNNEKPLTYGMIADYLNVTTQTITNYAKGVRTPRYEQLKGLKEILNTSYERLFGETESNKIEYIELVDKLGLSSEAIAELEKRSKVDDNWGIRHYSDVPNLYFFGINKLILSGPIILAHIGDLLSYPTKDNKYLDKETLEKLNNNQTKIPIMELYTYRIAKDLLELQKTTGASKEVADFSWQKLEIDKINNKEYEKFKETHKDLIEEEERIKREVLEELE